MKGSVFVSKQKVKLEICGLNFVISTDDTEESVREAAHVVEQAIHSVIDHNNRASITMASIITALSYYDDYRRASMAADNLRTQIKNYLEDASRSRLEADESRKEIERMKKEIRTLRARLTGAEPEMLENSSKNTKEKTPKESVSHYIKPTISDVLPDQESFISFFEKKED